VDFCEHIEQLSAWTLKNAAKPVFVLARPANIAAELNPVPEMPEPHG
jgi:hypothetical protein